MAEYRMPNSDLNDCRSRSVLDLCIVAEKGEMHMGSFRHRSGMRRNAVSLAPATLLALVIAISGALISGVAAQDATPSPMAGGVTVEPFGTTKDGQAVELYTLTNANGMVVSVMTYGGIVQKVLVP